VSYRGRFAPTPSGPLHLGSLLAACASWADARAAGGAWIVRIEDLDPPREQPGADQLITSLLDAVGLQSDQPVLRQSTRSAAYEAALQQLLRADLAFECHCSRSDLSAVGGVHRGACVVSSQRGPAAVRLRVPDLSVGFVDRLQGHYQQALLQDVGDFVLRRADGLYAYQLAVVVDDAWQQISDVVRGSDLLDSTPRQIYLQRCLGFATPRYAHVPVLIGADGQKLSKQNLAPAVTPAEFLERLPQLLAWLGHGGGDLQSLAKDWKIEQVPRQMAINIAVSA